MPNSTENVFSTNSRLRSAIVLIGLPGCGKTIGASYLQNELGFVSISAGDVVRDLCKAEGLPISRASLSKYGRRLLSERGYEHFGELLLERACKHEKVVFEGIRPPEVVQWIKRRVSNSLVVFIEASEETRLTRLTARGEDMSGYRKTMSASMEQDIVKFKPLSDAMFENEGDVSALYSFLKETVKIFRLDGDL